MRKIIRIIFLLFIVIGFILLGCNYLYSYDKLKTSDKKVDNFLKKETVSNNKKTVSLNNYVFVIEIPKINLKRGVYDINSVHNNVNENITILKKTSNIIVLAAHSGNADVSYFKNLYKLKKGDYIYLYSGNKKSVYKVDNFYEEEKDGDISVTYNIDRKTLVLTTCKGKDKQLVYVAYLK